MPAADDDDVEGVATRYCAHRDPFVAATMLEQRRHDSTRRRPCVRVLGALRRRAGARGSRARSGSAANAAIVERVERVALCVQGLDAARAELGAVRGIGRDEVPLRFDVRADEPRDARARAAVRRARRRASRGRRDRAGYAMSAMSCTSPATASSRSAGCEPPKIRRRTATRGTGRRSRARRTRPRPGHESEEVVDRIEGVVTGPLCRSAGRVGLRCRR